jgi:formylglycine-generating enzyme required for sulfatase activity
MLPDHYRWIVDHFEPEGDPGLLFEIAKKLEDEGNREGAATVYDRAYGLDPTLEDIRTHRARVLDQLSVTEHGLRFRYVPYGSFLMGYHFGEPDEAPWHPVWLSPFWMSEMPVSWADYCRLMDWEPPPSGIPHAWQDAGQGFDRARFSLYQANKIRLQYCETHTTRAIGWHAHYPRQQDESAEEAERRLPPRTDSAAPWEYDAKPMVAVSWQEATELADRLSTSCIRYSLPTEAQWEKAARGGLVGARYAWGDELPTSECCDFGRFHEFSILPPRTLPPNGYGLYAVNGCVWEWARDWYDRDYYRHAPETDPQGPAQGEEKVLRGGSWTDCAEAVTVTFRISRASSGRTSEGAFPGDYAANIGFRFCRTVGGEH